MLRLFGSNYTAVRNFFQENTVPDDYGVFEQEMAYPEEEGNVVVVPANALTLSDECLVELQKSVEPLSQDGDHWISLYLRARDIIKTQQLSLDSNFLSLKDMSFRISLCAILASIIIFFFSMAFKLGTVNCFRQFLKIAFIQKAHFHGPLFFSFFLFFFFRTINNGGLQMMG